MKIPITAAKGILIGTALLAVTSPLVPAQIQPAPDQVRIKTILDLDPNPNPSGAAAFSTLIVRATVKKREFARSVRNHPLSPALKLHWGGDYAWHDVLFEKKELIWRDRGIKAPGKEFYVRVYNAETPEVSYKVDPSPYFHPGEEYILCLVNRDNLAFKEEPKHWIVVGHFYLDKNGRAVIKYDTRTTGGWSKQELIDKLKIGTRDKKNLEYMRKQRRNHPKTAG